MPVSPGTSPGNLSIADADFDEKATAQMNYINTLCDDLEAAGGILTVDDRQASPTDTTADALMKVGAFGLGAAISYAGQNVDLDSVAYGFGANGGVGDYPLNNPTGVTSSRWAWETYGHPNAAVQIAARTDTWSGAYLRSMSVGSWRTWERFVFQSDIVGSASQSGGEATGAVIEAGVNANGRYTRLADGTQICIIPSISLLASSDVTWTFPAAFSSAPAVAGVGITNADRIITTAGAVGTTSVGLRAWAMQSTPARSTTPASVTAIGRWF